MAATPVANRTKRTGKGTCLFTFFPILFETSRPSETGRSDNGRNAGRKAPCQTGSITMGPAEQSTTQVRWNDGVVEPSSSPINSTTDWDTAEPSDAGL